MKKLPLIQLTINPDDGSFVQAISLVEDPAIQSDFIAFSNQSKIDFTANDERMELLGIAMKANHPIYRNSPETGEYACIFSPDTIRQIAQVYAQKGFFNNMNIEHSDTPAGSYVFQSYIVDSTKNMNAPKGIDAGDGDWMVGVKVNDPKVWANIRSGKTKGFSVEGIFNLIDTQQTINMHNQEAYLKALEDFNTAFEDLLA